MTTRKLDTEVFKGSHASIRIGSIAVSSKRAARKAYPAQDVTLCDKEGNELGSIRFYGGQLEIYLDPRIRVNLNQSRFYFPEAQTEENNDADIIREAERKKADMEAQGMKPDLGDVLGMHSWDKRRFVEDQVIDTTNHYTITAR